MRSIHGDSSSVTEFYHDLFLPRCLNPQNEWQACNMIFLMPHENILKIHFNPHLHATEVVWITMPNPHLCMALIICNVLQLNEIIRNKWQLLFPPVYPILLMLLKYLERCEALVQFDFQPCFQFMRHLWSMYCSPTNRVHLLMCGLYDNNISLPHPKKLQLLDGKFNNASTFF